MPVQARLKFAVRFLLFFCLLGLVFVIPARSATHANTAPAWLIKQTSYNLGQVDILLTKDGMKWHNEKLGITLLMHAPDWKLNAYNDANKKYLVLTKDEALELFQHQRRKTHAGIEGPIKLGDRPKVAGMSTIGYCYSHDHDQMPEKFAVDLTNAIESGKKLSAEQKTYLDGAFKHQRREYWVSKEIVISPRIRGVFLERTVQTKYSDNMPLRLIQYGRDGSKTTLFDTTIVRKGLVSEDSFKMPAGYTKAENKISLLVNDQDLGGGFEDPELAGKPNNKGK